jgi:hypothetical protein
MQLPKLSALYAEERLSQLVARNQDRMVLTHDGGTADYRLNPAGYIYRSRIDEGSHVKLCAL